MKIKTLIQFSKPQIEHVVLPEKKTDLHVWLTVHFQIIWVTKS